MSATSRPIRRRAVAAAGALALLFVLGACGGDEGGNVVADATEDAALPTQSTLAPSTTLPSAAGQPCVEPVEVPEAEGKPVVEMPVGETPTALVSTDITVGDGAEAEVGKTIKVHYVGIACSTGNQFDSSWDRGEPTEFPLAEGGLIDGWVQGIPGMKVGGRRQLVIPSEMAYGPDGQGDIAPDEALIFVIDLIDVTDGPAETPAEPGAEEPATDASEPAAEDTAPAAE